MEVWLLGRKPGPQAPSAAQGTSQTPAAGPEELGGNGKEDPSVSARVLATALTAAARDHLTSGRRTTRGSLLRRPDGTRQGPRQHLTHLAHSAPGRAPPPASPPSAFPIEGPWEGLGLEIMRSHQG